MCGSIMHGGSGGSRIYRRGVQDCNARNARARKILGATPTFDKPRPKNAFRKYIQRTCSYIELASKLV